VDSLEHSLLIAAQAGDIDAYTELQLLLEPDIRRYVRRFMSDPYTVDDVVQETFLAFYQHLQAIAPVEMMRSYLYRIARNKCYDNLRGYQRHREHESLDEDEVHLRVSFTEAHHQPRPDDLTHWMLLHLEVQQAIEQLPEVQRETLQLFCEEQMTYGEIAAVTGSSIGTVKSRLFYARKNLRGLLRAATLAVLDEEFAAENREKSSHARKETDDEGRL
jgi:RNA polymerase sigma-70 factor (ECF subfamily)